ncbi:UDP-N-acetylglucosamine 1-carboxyvinyltransferase [Treponema endosymbiont of Eucomonympha sp.]|uniref:UDP-N-acetylglucosamine 1-carboxyvinyltransferase n=1 Tax=Treponema endosymbiont of Eucomonympha sp. TaxID=1580831 RepID=UPI0007510E43|nr:UDP-N-acetylglucosamine 1-carboxyvinyltransferase [Treponema endosymbiont of Eucomonympha sp.]
MAEYRIEGGVPVHGSIQASGNKNAALPCIAAALLTSEPVTLRNIPNIADTAVMLDAVRALGAKVERLGAHEWRIEASGAIRSEVPRELAQHIRASILFAGPLLARTGAARLPPPGGDVIGRRRLDTHFLALTELGASAVTNGTHSFRAAKLCGADIFLDEASVTATENALMAAARAEGQTVLTNAASEPHVQDLCRLLNEMGADISGIGSNVLRINGAAELHGADFAVGTDYMEIGSFIGLAAATRGSVTISGANPRDMRPIQTAFRKLGIRWSMNGTTLTVPEEQELKVNSDRGGMIPKIDDAPWPGFPPDLTSIMTVVATQVDGTVLIHEKMFESRMFFVDRLIGMGARVTLCDPHRAVVSGPCVLHGEYSISPDVRAGMALVIASLAAEGESVISNVYQVERGYENLAERLQNLGARITRTE